MEPKKILVCGNCISFGLKDCFKQLNPNLETERLSSILALDLEGESLSELNSYDLIISFKSQGLSKKYEEAKVNKSKIFYYTGINFSGFHPDFTYLNHGNETFNINNRFGSYHSMIILASFLNKVPKDQIPQLLLNNQLYQDLGYYEIWSTSKALLIKNLNNFGFNGQELFSTWAANQDIFMYTGNHPNLSVVFEYARHILQKLNIPIYNHVPLIQDNLLNSIVIPTFPPIADHFGLRGRSTYFKKNNNTQLFPLEDFIEASIETYSSIGAPNIKVPDKHEERFNLINTILKKYI